MAKNGRRIKWQEEPQAHDYPAALSYLTLLFEPKTAKAHVKSLKRARVQQFKAKDIFRASRLPLLGISNLHLERDKRKIAAGEGLSPLLLVRDRDHGLVIIADGYHRLCAVYTQDEDAVVPCKIV